MTLNTKELTFVSDGEPALHGECVRGDAQCFVERAVCMEDGPRLSGNSGVGGPHGRRHDVVPRDAAEAGIQDADARKMAHWL